jgi:hypothetical protein
LRLTADIGALTQAPNRVAAETSIAEALYHVLRERGVSYARESWTGLTRQQIRHPRWLIEDEWGTCLDLAVTYAAMCLEAHLAPLLAITDRHALVVLQPGRQHAPSAVPPFSAGWARRRDEEVSGILEVCDGESAQRSLASGELLAVDIVAATSTYSGDFDDALDRGGNYLSDGTVLVDVAYLHNAGAMPLPPPAERPSIRMYLPGGHEHFMRYADHSDVLEQLEKQSGTVVLVAPAGQGKSTLARQVVLDAPFGAGWFLNASERRTLIGSLAAADLAERNELAPRRASADRVGYSDDALMRLAEAEGHWVLVYDNADGDPGDILPLMPHPQPGQLVLVTTTNAEWERVPGIRALRLPALSDETVAAELGGPDLAELVGGRALLLLAFRALLGWSGESPAAVAARAPADIRADDPTSGPGALWAVLRERLGEAIEPFCLQLAYLPPDQQPLELLEALNPDAPEFTATLARTGLVTLDRGALRLHRLFGEAIRTDVRAREPDLDAEVVLGLANSRDAFQMLDGYGDRDTLFRLDEQVRELDDSSSGPDERLGTALYMVAELLESAGHTRLSGQTYARASRHLARRTELLAGSLHGRARTVNQHHAGDEKMLREALSWATRAEELLLSLPGHEGEADRCLAMQGLLKQKLAKFPGPGETTLELLRDALGVIEEAHGKRVIRLDPMDPELARSEFNLAGIRIELAKLERGRAREHLDIADRVYASVAELRERIYGRSVHPHIAACVVGRGYVGYYRALLLPATAQVRTNWLRDASAYAGEALGQREALEGSRDGDETRKVLRFLAKVALARRVPSVGAARELSSVQAEVSRELEFAAVRTLPSNTRALERAIADWVFSPALAAVVAAFGVTAPQPGTELGEALEWLEEFSLRWDFRGGAERNLVGDQRLDDATRDVVLQAAAALGLVGTSAPAAENYDHVLILGGLVRACVARPIYAARLLDTGTIAARDITALGGFRELKGNELDLAASLGYEDLVDEFHAMDAGVRSAFKVDPSFDERGEQSDVVGAAWAVREYRLPTDGVVRVVGAPSSEPGVRRANTPDTYVWYASELARLRPGERVLIVTSDIYVPYQHADALRMLALPYSVEVDAVGIAPGDAHPSLAQTFEAHNYLQEFRSTLRAFRALHEGLTAVEQ